MNAWKKIGNAYGELTDGLLIESAKMMKKMKK